MNKQTLKKHHFWVLAGLVPLIVFISFLLITSGVGGAIDRELTTFKKTETELNNRKTVKPVGLINELNSQIEELKKKKGEMWKKNWELQQKQFTTPPLMKMDKLAFGDSIPNPGQEREFIMRRDVYNVEFEKMAASVAPTQFLGESKPRDPKDPNSKSVEPWMSVLRHVNEWGSRVPDPSWIWQALEDIWIQRTLLGAVQSVNDQIATFSQPKEDTKLTTPVKHYKCESRLWEVELWLERQGKDTIIRGKLKNRTDRMQILGIGNTMKLLVWLNDANLDKESAAFEFHIEGEFVRANSYAQATEKDTAPVIKELPTHLIKEGGPTANGIFKVRQKFDARTVPVRMIEQVALNNAPDENPRDLDARHLQKVLLPFKTEEKKDGTDASKGTTTAPPPPMAMAPGAAPVAGAIGGTVESIILANKYRYLVVTPQVRRMSVMMRVVLDQMYVEDFLVAMANMPLRFQTTQVDWTRFRGTLPSSGGPATGGNSGDGSDSPVQTTSQVDAGAGFRTSTGDPYRGTFAPSVPRQPGGFPGGPSGSMTTVSEGQLTAGLVSVSVYGIMSLYMKYNEESPAKDAK